MNSKSKTGKGHDPGSVLKKQIKFRDNDKIAKLHWQIFGAKIQTSDAFFQIFEHSDDSFYFIIKSLESINR